MKFMYKPLILFSILFTMSSSLAAQNGDYQYRGDEFYSYDEELNLYLEADYDSRRKDKSEYVHRLLKVFSNTDNGLREIQSKMLEDSCGGFQSYTFGDDYDTYSRKFVLIRGKYCFYIYDLRQRQLYGAFTPFFWGTGQSDNKGEIMSLEISKDGNAVYGLSYENGCFYYDVSDLRATSELIPSNMPFFGSNRVYLLPSGKDEKRFDVLYLYEERGELFTKVIFDNLDLNTKDRTFLLDLDERKKEEMIMAATLEENRYTVFEEITKYGTRYRVVDVFIGRAVELPKNKNFRSREDVYEFLSE
jgi:hypothetical protein